MKTYTLLLAILSSSASLYAQQSDSTSVTTGQPEEVVTVQHSDSISSPLNWDFSWIEGRDGHHRVTISFGRDIDMNAGFVLPIHSPADMKFKHWTSLEAEINLLSLTVVPNYSKWWYSLNLGLGVSQMYMKDNTMTYADYDGNLLFGPYPEGAEPKSSALRSAFECNTLMAHRRFAKGRSLGLGLSLRLIGYPVTRTEYVDAEGKSRVSMSEVGSVRPCQWSFVTRYHFDQSIYFYLRFSPWGQYHSNGGPNYPSLSLGFGAKF